MRRWAALTDVHIQQYEAHGIHPATIGNAHRELLRWVVTRTCVYVKANYSPRKLIHDGENPAVRKYVRLAAKQFDAPAHTTRTRQGLPNFQRQHFQRIDMPEFSETFDLGVTNLRQRVTHKPPEYHLLISYILSEKAGPLLNKRD